MAACSVACSAKFARNEAGRLVALLLRRPLLPRLLLQVDIPPEGVAERAPQTVAEQSELALALTLRHLAAAEASWLDLGTERWFRGGGFPQTLCCLKSRDNAPCHLPILNSIIGKGRCLIISILLSVRAMQVTRLPNRVTRIEVTGNPVRLPLPVVGADLV